MSIFSSPPEVAVFANAGGGAQELPQTSAQAWLHHLQHAGGRGARLGGPENRQKEQW